jgi:hypothetical protein
MAANIEHQAANSTLEVPAEQRTFRYTVSGTM